MASGYSLVKRDGNSVSFDSKKILNAIIRAGRATSEFESETAHILLKDVMGVIEEKFLNKKSIHIEDVQDIVEITLAKKNFFKTARAYITYRERHKRLRKDKKTLLDVEKSVNEYLSKDDWRVNANANQGYSLGGLILNVSGKVTANYWLDHIYSEDIAKAHRNGDLHIHDLDMLSGYCAGWSLRMLLQEGLNGVSGKVEAAPPKHFSSAIGQIVNFLGTLQNEWAGAQSFSSFDTLMSPYVKIDNLSYKQVKQFMQELIYNLNVPSRWGSQTPFTNLTFDLTCPDDMKNTKPIIAGSVQDFTYGTLVNEMEMINQAFLEIMTEGDNKGRVFTFPIPTYNITSEFDWDSKLANFLFEVTAKYGLPYFQNFINSDLSPTMIRSMCCRLQLDLRELLKRGNGLFGAAELTGSVGIVTINCARLGYVYKNNNAALYEKLDYLLECAKNSLEDKRKVVQNLMDNGLFPYSKRFLGSLRNYFSTIGVNGINEMIRNFTDDKHNISDDRKNGETFKIM